MDVYTRRMDLRGYPIRYSAEVYSYWQTEVGWRMERREA